MNSLPISSKQITRDSNPLRVLHLISSLGDGGAEAVLYRLCLADRTHEHSVISMMGKGRYGPLLESAGVTVITLDMPQGKLTVKGLFKLCRVLKDLNPDVFQTWLYHADLVGGLLGRLMGVHKVIWGVHNSNLIVEVIGRKTLWVAKSCALLSRRIPSEIISCANRSAREHISLGYFEPKMRIVPNGYDLSTFVPDLKSGEQLKRQLEIPIGVTLLGMVARFDAQKDHNNLFKALADLASKGVAFKCLLVGQNMNHQNSAVTSNLEQHGLLDDVILLGPREDIPAIMSALDIHVLSSLGESFPNVLAEAMACGTPCVTTDVGDAAEIVGDTGWVVPPQDSHSLSAAIFEAISAKESSRSWALRKKECRDYIKEHFDISRMAEGYSRVWAEK